MCCSGGGAASVQATLQPSAPLAGHRVRRQAAHIPPERHSHPFGLGVVLALQPRVGGGARQVSAEPVAVLSLARHVQLPSYAAQGRHPRPGQRHHRLHLQRALDTHLLRQQRLLERYSTRRLHGRLHTPRPDVIVRHQAYAQLASVQAA